MNQQNAMVIGAGIVGLSLIRALQAKGWKVTVIERHSQAQDA